MPVLEKQSLTPSGTPASLPSKSFSVAFIRQTESNGLIMVEEERDPEPDISPVPPLDDPSPEEPPAQEPPSGEPEQKFMTDLQDRFCDS
jgi:hypothetical protein